MAERGREIGWTNEDTVDTVDLGDRFQLIERSARLDLHQDADLVIRLGQITRHAAIAAGAGRDRDAANSLWRIARRSDRALRFLDVLHIRKEKRLRADVERSAWPARHRSRPDE